MTMLPIQPVPPVGPWIETYRGYLRAHGIRIDKTACELTEAHVGFYVNALLLNPALDDRARDAIRCAFFTAGIATLVPSDPPARSSEAAAAIDAPRVALWRSEDEEPEQDDEEEEPEVRQYVYRAGRKRPPRRR